MSDFSAPRGDENDQADPPESGPLGESEPRQSDPEADPAVAAADETGIVEEALDGDEYLYEYEDDEEEEGEEDAAGECEEVVEGASDHDDSDEPCDPVEQSVDAAAALPMPRRDVMVGPPVGIRRADAEGLECLDAMAGRSCLLGFGVDPIGDAIRVAAESYLGDAAALNDRPSHGDGLLLQQVQELLGDSGGVSADSLLVCSSADMAVESAITLARTWKPGTAHRTLTLVGSDHGRSGVCRTASGRPELHDGYGPMMSGFAHVPGGDIGAMRAAVDDETSCVLIASVDLNNASLPLDADYLRAVRELCDERDILLIIDESRLCFASSGRPLAFRSIADIRADAVILGGGLFAGLAGGLVVASRRLTHHEVVDTATYPLLVAVASATLGELASHRLPASVDDSMRRFAVALAEQVGGFEFVRDVHVLGMTIGIETDVASSELVAAAKGHGIRVEAAGETSIRMQLPVVISDDDRDRLLSRLGQAMQWIEKNSNGREHLIMAG